MPPNSAGRGCEDGQERSGQALNEPKHGRSRSQGSFRIHTIEEILGSLIPSRITGGGRQTAQRLQTQIGQGRGRHARLGQFLHQTLKGVGVVWLAAWLA